MSKTVEKVGIISVLVLSLVWLLSTAYALIVGNEALATQVSIVFARVFGVFMLIVLVAVLVKTIISIWRIEL